MSKVSNKTKNTIVKPAMKVVGDDKQHALETLFEGPTEKLPVIKSVGFMKVPGKNSYVSYSISSKGKEILSIEVDEPNLRPIAEESAKILFVDQFLGDE